METNRANPINTQFPTNRSRVFDENTRSTRLKHSVNLIIRINTSWNGCPVFVISHSFVAEVSVMNNTETHKHIPPRTIFLKNRATSRYKLLLWNNSSSNCVFFKRQVLFYILAIARVNQNHGLFDLNCFLLFPSFHQFLNV